MARPARETDEGFTLVEVVVSLALLSIIATAALYFFLSGTRTVTHEQRTQNAVQVANQAMERAYGVLAKPTGVSGISGVLVGRSQDAVLAAWDAASGVDGLADTYPAWDPDATAGSDPAVPIVHDQQLDGVHYVATTYIGNCYRARGAAQQACGRTASATDPAAVPAGYSRLMRVMVEVTWTGAACETTGCHYQIGSLVDPNDDLVWNNTTRPIAVDDDAVVPIGTSVVVDVVRNDIIGIVVNNPVIRLEAAAGQGTVALRSDGTVLYTAPSNASGIFSFTYALKDRSGRESNTGTVHVQVLPKAVDDTAHTGKNQPVDIDVLPNDLGTYNIANPGFDVTDVPSDVTVTPVSGGKLRFDPHGHVGEYSFSYAFTTFVAGDYPDLVSSPARVTVTVTEWSDPLGNDALIGVPATTSNGAGTAPVPWTSLTSSTSDYLLRILSTGGASLQVNGTTVTTAPFDAPGTSTFSATAPGSATQLGDWSALFQVLTPEGSISSDTHTLRVVVVPQAKPDPSATTKRGTPVSIDLDANDWPANVFAMPGVTDKFEITVAQPTAPNCGSVAAPTGTGIATGTVRYTPPSSAKTCTFTYSIVGKGALASLSSPQATVTVKVTN